MLCIFCWFLRFFFVFFGYPTAEKTSLTTASCAQRSAGHLLLHLGMPIRVVTQGSGDVLPHLRGQALQGLPVHQALHGFRMEGGEGGWGRSVPVELTTFQKTTKINIGTRGLGWLGLGGSFFFPIFWIKENTPTKQRKTTSSFLKKQWIIHISYMEGEISDTTLSFYHFIPF